MKNKTCLVVLMLSGLALFLNTGCTRNISANTYSAQHVGEASMTYSGVIVSRRVVQVAEEEYVDNTAGIATGAIGGGVLGSQIGSGSGSVVAAVAGAVIGGVAGGLLEDELKKQDAYEYVVQLDQGGMMTVVQGVDTEYGAGQRVLVIVGKKGRSRIIPANQ